MVKSYDERGRDEEALMVQERALSVMKCMDDSTDVINMRVSVTMYLAEGCGSLAVKYNTAKNTDSVTSKELTLAEE